MSELKDIEKQIDDTRSEMDETIDAIADRVSLRRLGDKTMNAIKERAPQMPAGTHRFYAERPLIVGTAVMALGLGIGLLFSPTGRRSDVKAGSGHLAQDLGRKVVQVKDRLASKAGTMGERAQEGVQNVKQRTNEAVHSVGQKASEVTTRAKEGLGNVAEKTTDAAGRARERVGEAAENATERIGDVADRAKERVGELTERGEKKRGPKDAGGQTTTTGTGQRTGATAATRTH